jgi:hypothetical protein
MVKSRFSRRSIRHRGVSLIESVLYLVIALAVVLGGIVFFSEAQLSNRVMGASRAGIAISSEVRGLFMQQKSFGANDLSTAMVSSGAVPGNYKNRESGVVEHPFNGLLRVQGNLEGFALVFEDLPIEACMRMVTIGENGEGALGTGVRGIVFSDDSSSLNWDGDLSDEDGWQPAPIGVTDASSFCTDGGDIVISYNRS